MKNTKELLIRSSLVAIGIISGICLAYILFRNGYNFLPNPNQKEIYELATRTKSDTVELKKAIKSLKAYRKNRALLSLSVHKKEKMQGILHDSIGFTNFYWNFIDFCKKHSLKGTPYKWGMGLYPNIIRDSINNSPKLNIYFIPTMYNTNTNEICDFLLDPCDSCYIENKFRGSSAAAKSNVYDQGTMFP